MRAALLPVLLLLGAPLAGCLVPPGVEGQGYAATVRWTSYGIPHVLARDWGGLGYGYGHAFASQNLCSYAEEVVTLRGERSLHWGPDDSYSTLPGLYEPLTNEESDVFYRFLAASPDRHPSPLASAGPELTRFLEGFVAGYNRYLAEGGEEPCRGEPWVQPLTAQDLERRLQKLVLYTGSVMLARGVARAAPPGLAPAPEAPSPAGSGAGLALPLGSNAFAYGSEATATGRGLLLGNPHFPWRGAERLHEVHLTIPGVLDVMGAALYGVPLVLIGFNEHVAWSHTVSFARRFTLHELTLVPGRPTAYVVDGTIEEMEPRSVALEVRGAAGPERREHTVWLTRYGPVADHFWFAGLEIPLPWTAERAYALQDVNARNDRAAEQFLRLDTARSFDAFVGSLREVHGLPWVHTVAASPDGRVFYGDVSVLPNVSDEQLQRCMRPLGTATQPLPIFVRLIVLDGARSDCDWVRDPRARQERTLPAEDMPSVELRSYVVNSNDSHWLPNPRERLEGYPRIVGDERTERTLRTRMGYVVSEERLAGQADCTIDAPAPCDKFTPVRLEAALLDDRSFFGELARDDIVGGVCPLPLGPSVGAGGIGLEDLREACEALRAWDLRADLDSKGFPLFDRFARNATLAALWATPFDERDPVGTPRDFLGADPKVRAALADAVAQMRAAGVALNASPREAWGVLRGGERIPLHGGWEFTGVLNQLDMPLGARGFGEPGFGSSYIQVVTWDERGPVADAILAYGQVAEPSHPHAADQTRLFAAKQWVRLPFHEEDILADPVLEVVELRG